MQVALDYIGKRGATVGVTKEKRIKFVLLKLLHFTLLFYFHLIYISNCYAGMPKRFFRKKCFLMLVLGSIVRQKRLITLGKEFFCKFLFTCLWLLLLNHYHFLFSPGISSIGFFYVH